MTDNQTELIDSDDKIDDIADKASVEIAEAEPSVESFTESAVETPAGYDYKILEGKLDAILSFVSPQPEVESVGVVETSPTLLEQVSDNFDDLDLS